jgi:putative CocE/NonD family hydrolase
MARRFLQLLICVGFATSPALAAEPVAPAPPPLVPWEVKTEADIAKALAEFYTKREVRIRMRDGVRLFTHLYAPKDHSRDWPILLMRTPYSVAPYGVDNTPDAQKDWTLRAIAPAPSLVRSGFVFVQQDVRGRMMSEGEFVDIRPVVPHRTPQDVDESTDAWDTIDWLVKHVPDNNGRVGAWGISYPGFYAAQSLIEAHPALKAVSPQAPVTEWFLGDDFHHNGALFLADAFLFYQGFGRPRPKPVPKVSSEFEGQIGDVYDFFLELGPLAQVNARWFQSKIPFWNEILAHPNRDAWWQARDPRPHWRKVTPAVLTVGGWYDAEDLWGTLETWRTIEAQNPGARNQLVVGPWRHGGWQRSDGDQLGDVQFGAKTSHFYREQVVAPFFLHHLKGIGPAPATEAWLFETGTNEWRQFSQWPPHDAKSVALYLREDGQLRTERPSRAGHDSYLSDPAKPVPYRDRHGAHRDADYMIEDQRFASRRPDVLSYRTAPVADEWTLAGPVEVELQVSLSCADADFVVKLVDVWPDDARDPEPNPKHVRMAGYQQLVRAEVMRGRFRDSFEQPKPFAPNTPTLVKFRLPDVLHTWRAGHRLMVQVQSSWFPLVDRNPQTWVEIAQASEADFRPATITVLRGSERASKLTVGVLRGEAP